jgi:hypothetical protein
MYQLVLSKTIFTMLLIIVGSLVGISSIYTPVNVETQPQPQPQKPQTTLGGVTTPQSKIELGQQVIDQNIRRSMEENQLLNRLMPKIVDRIDVKLVLTQRPGQINTVQGYGAYWAKAACPPGETAVSLGYEHRPLEASTNEYIMTVKRGAQDSHGKASDPNSNVWNIKTRFEDGGGMVYTYAECLKVVLSLKGPQQPQQQSPSQPQQPAQPPGGPPLRPPPEFGK